MKTEESTLLTRPGIKVWIAGEYGWAQVRPSQRESVCELYPSPTQGIVNPAKNQAPHTHGDRAGKSLETSTHIFLVMRQDFPPTAPL